MQYSHLEGINIGSGPHYAEGWLNTDLIPTDSGKQPDLLIDIHSLHYEFDHHAFKKAYVGHVLEHIQWGQALEDAIDNLAYVAETVMVVGPCMDKAIATNQPKSLLAAIEASPTPNDHPWDHKWTPTEALTAEAIRAAGYTPHIVDIATVTKPEWPNPSTACWQTAMWFTST